ncbi:hypothetical protein K492DRAFT_173222 [Lichtheimia hyalospora FSU 10163]|nr:hypothetical protein K492DRAFT_173222 [Lichtheimia hyalospora FSU 10163]
MATSHHESTAPKSPCSPPLPLPKVASLTSEPSGDDIVISLEADEEEEEAIFGESDPYQQEKEHQVNDVESSKQEDMLHEQEVKHQQRLDELKEQQERRVREKERMEREQKQDQPSQQYKRPRMDNDRRMPEQQHVRTRPQHRPSVSNSNTIRVGGRGRGRGRGRDQQHSTPPLPPPSASSAPRRYSRDNHHGYDRTRDHQPLPPQQAIVPRSGSNREPLNYRHRSPTPPPFPEPSWQDHSRRVIHGDARRVITHSRERPSYPKPSERRDWPKNRQRARSPLPPPPPLPPAPRPRETPLPPRRPHHANGYHNDYPHDNYYDRHRQQAGYDHSRANGYSSHPPPPPLPPPPSRQYPPLRRQDERRLVDRPPPRRLERGRGAPYRPMYRRNGDFR